MYTEETKVTIAPSVEFPAQTFDDILPVSVIYLHEGDHVTLTLHNLDQDSPTSYISTSPVPPIQEFSPVPVNEPGVFLYHCESSPMPLHLAEGCMVQSG